MHFLFLPFEYQHTHAHSVPLSREETEFVNVVNAQRIVFGVLATQGMSIQHKVELGRGTLAEFAHASSRPGSSKHGESVVPFPN